ncbi:Vomeronasal type-2 receptor 26 [Heterocephalus glaber]|uniref:Vomeronasal type-2 receptor 26 n=1 Tax=Heterocephalus glaber TaxID=10181 RepID=G5B9J0_HETGA|nr:Vomeronasal type-2 receptor 26 [Heterocephalus glaber]
MVETISKDMEEAWLKELTFGAFDPEFSETSQFPSVHQMASKDESLALGMVSLMLHFHWTWVGLVITAGQNGFRFLSDVRGEMDKNGVCVAFVKMIENAIASYLWSPKLQDFLSRETSPVNVVIIYYDTDSLNDINYQVGVHLVTWRVWVTNTQWHAELSGRNFILDSFHGSLVFTHHYEEISGFNEFIQTATPFKYPEDTFLTLYWFRNFRCSFSDSDCSLKDCTPNASLAWLPANRFDTAMSEGSYNAYNAVYLVAYALQEMLLQQGEMQLIGSGDTTVFSPWQLIFGGFDPEFSENSQFPSVHQMASKDESLALGMVSSMLHFHWTWVGLVITAGQNGFRFLSDVRGEMDKNGVCVAFVKMIKNAIASYLWSPKLQDFLSRETSPVNVVIIYYDTDSLNDINYQVRVHLVTWRVWVTNTQWHAELSGRNFILDSFHESLVFTHHYEEISGFDEFIQTATPFKYPEDTFLTLYWFRNFRCSFSDSDCSLKDCTPNASLAWLPANRFDTAMSEGSYNAYNAVYLVAYSLQEMLLQQGEMQLMGSGDTTVFFLWQLHPFLKDLQFNSPTGEQVNLDKANKVGTKYDILNLWNFPEGVRLRVKVGGFSPQAPLGQQLSVSEEMIEWAAGITETPRSVCSESCSSGFRKSPQEGKPACCFDCTPCPENEIANETDKEQCMKCPDHQYANTQQNHCIEKSVTFLTFEDPMGKALAGTALSLTVLTAAVLGLFVKHRDTPIVKANNRNLSYILLISLIFCFLCSLLFVGRPNTATCILQQTTFGVVFTVAVSTVLAKTVTVVLAFKVTAPGRRMRQLLVSGTPNYIIPICCLIQLTLCGVWMGTNPPYIDTDAHSEHGHIIIVCNKGSLTAFYCVLGYLGSLALVSFTVAFLARNLPDTFNEAKFLTFSMLVFCSVWVTFLPVYHSTKVGKVMVAMEVFILASGAGLLACIFAPKCYIILLREDRLSLPKFKDTIYTRSKNPS